MGDKGDLSSSKKLGLSTEEAMEALCSEMDALIASFETRMVKNRWKSLFQAITKRTSSYTVFSVVYVTVLTLLLIVASAMGPETRFASGTFGWLILECFLLITSLVLNLLNVSLNVKKDYNKYIGSKKNGVKLLRESICGGSSWNADSYPNLHMPLSPCISMQWCLRDQMLVNLPHALLAKGDVIVMRPGLPTPGECESLEDGSVLQTGDIFAPVSNQSTGGGPQPRVPMSTQKFLLKEAPIVKNLRSMLEEEMSKPVSFLENERYTVCSLWLERRILPAFAVLFFAVSLLRYLLFDPSGAHWTEYIIVIQVHGVLPLVPILLPFTWTVVNTLGQARIYTAFEMQRSIAELKQSSESLGSCSDVSVDEAPLVISAKDTMECFLSMLYGSHPISSSEFELLHALGSVTALCCVDKKGILSYPNPSAEKVFFFSSKPKKRPPDDHDDEDKQLSAEKKTKRKKRLKSLADNEPPSNIEVLDLTHDTSKDAFSVLFDDLHWKNHLSALKPMGLSILLNTCNATTWEWYTTFTDHVSCAARENKDTVAVVNRRCMCLLSREIGFTDEAVGLFSHEATLGLYRQVPAEEAEREKQNRARSFIQHKIPMPNQVSVVVRDKLSGICQLLTQGTGDLVVDCCTDAWNGTDLQVLSELDRKRLLDFYHRNSMIAYCTAFAYKPLPKSMEDWTSNVYTELMESPSATKVTHGEDVGVFLELEDGEMGPRQRSHSVDSLLELSPSSSMEDFVQGKILQSHQTFTGMVSLQYQAKEDFVQMIDKLESACIRFVHFSKENEVRSRVFAEKMGIEAGWNCHVSLMAAESVASPNSSCRNLSSLSAGDAGMASPGSGGRTRDTNTSSIFPRPHSAPSFMNTDEVQVKFAKEPLPILIDQEVTGEEDSILLEDIGLGRNTTHETVALIEPLTDHTQNILMTGESALSLEQEEKQLLLEKNPHLLDVDAELTYEEDDEEEEEDFDVQSDSRYTSSYVTENTEDSLTGALDNRKEADFTGSSHTMHWRAEYEGEAHLPRGIENIRPHLKNVDNVPLLVNLFTDCVPEATHEMVKIMQDYGEVVVVVGSSLNMSNSPVFLQADCSIGIEPLYPQLCACEKLVSPPWMWDKPSPMELASRLLGLPCSFVFQRDDQINLMQLIMESRHYVFAMRNSFYLLLCCLLAVVIAQLVSSVLLLPPVLPGPHVLWLVLIVVPALSLSLMGNPNEPRTMSMATHKNTNHVNKQRIVEFFVQFGTRFLPSILVAVVCFIVVLLSFCHSTSPQRCSLYEFRFLSVVVDNSTNVDQSWTARFQGGLVMAQNVFHLYFVMFLVAISMSLVHWQDHLWQRCPFRNLAWSVTASVLLFLQLIFCVIDSYVRADWFGLAMQMSEVHPSVWAVGCAWPLVTIAVNELAKKREIKLAVRRQRRARLDFDTKLGMNSPF